MKRKSKRWLRWLGRPLERAQARFRRARPGSVLILVVALLVLLALMGTAYIASARLERYAASASSGQRMIRNSADAYANQLIEDVKSAVAADTANLWTARTEQQTTASGPKPLSSFLSFREPVLLPDLAVGGASNQFGPNSIPVWPAVSTLQQGQQYESPWKGSTYTLLGNMYFAPTNVVISYGTGADPSLIGQTHVYPAFMVFNPNLGGPGGQNPAPDPIHYYSSPYGPIGPVLAADTTGLGIADAPLYRLTSAPIQGVHFYAAVRVVDNADALNVNTAWDPSQDQDLTKLNSQQFFPSDLDLIGAMNATNATNEITQLNKRRFSGNPVSAGLVDDTGANHNNDVAYGTASEAFWMNLGRRVSYPSAVNFFGDPLGGYARPFSDTDTIGLAWHGGLVDQNSPLTKLDAQLKTTMLGKDSIYAGAANAVVNTRNRFRSFAANNFGFVYDWYWNFDSLTVGNQLAFPIGSKPQFNSFAQSSNSGHGPRFGSLRGWSVGANPVVNLCGMVDDSTLPALAKAGGGTTSAIWAPTAPTKRMTKVSLNTANFDQLWRGFVNGMGGSLEPTYNPATGTYKLAVPGDKAAPAQPTIADGSMFRNVLRDPAAGTTKSNSFSSPIDSASVHMDRENVLMLRAALAAVNVMTLRQSSSGYSANGSGATFFVPDPVRASISLATVGGPAQVQAVVYGVTANPYITEVYANNDQTQENGNQNEKGFVAVKLYNPYPYDLDLTDYQFAVIDRRASGTYPKMKVTPLATLDTTGYGQYLKAGDFVLVTNYSAAGGNPNTKYWPPGTGLAAPPSGHTIVQPDLHKVFEDPGTEAGGELVLLRKLQHGGAPVFEVPVDAFDFTGLQLTGNPNNDVMAWHYERLVGTAPADRWKFIFPGEYIANNSALPAPAPPRLQAHQDPFKSPDSNDPWAVGGDLNSALGSATGLGTYTDAHPGIELCNVDYGGFNKWEAGQKRVFPYGGFARVGDLVQAPFIGSYFIVDAATPINNVGPVPNPTQLAAFPTALLEINPVTLDSAVADDGDNDPNEDKAEYIGRFVPIVNHSTAENVDDYYYDGYYGSTDLNNTQPKDGTTRQNWRYRFAVNVFDQFTVVSNPDSDYFPNMNPAAWRGNGGPPPQPVPNTVANAVANKPNQNNEFISEGLININTASWRTLAAMQMIPPSKNTLYATGPLNPKGTLTYNDVLAKLIVRYRDVDDGVRPIRSTGLQGHGPFRSVLELNAAFDPSSWDPAKKIYTSTFRNALTLLPVSDPADPTFYQWGNYSPGSPAYFTVMGNIPKLKSNALDNLPANPWLQQTLMVDRISNLVCTRSDSFTAYIVVQGWRNAGTASPELVVQKRLAVLIDRSALPTTAQNTAGGMRVYNIPAD